MHTEVGSMPASTEAQLISMIVPPAVNMTLPRGVFFFFFEDILREGSDFAFSAAFKTMSSVQYAFVF